MNLNTQYETLLRRGMPEHPRVAIHDSQLRVLLGDAQWYQVSAPGDAFQIGKPIEYDDARDLIACHALRWIETLDYDGGYTLERLTLQRRKQSSLAFLRDIDDRLHEGYGDDPLEAILAATEHLEANNAK